MKIEDLDGAIDVVKLNDCLEAILAGKGPQRPRNGPFMQGFALVEPLLYKLTSYDTQHEVYWTAADNAFTFLRNNYVVEVVLLALQGARRRHLPLDHKRLAVFDSLDGLRI